VPGHKLVSSIVTALKGRKSEVRDLRYPGAPQADTANRATSAPPPAVALYVAWYNFRRVHMTLRVTPGMEASLTDHVGSVEELLQSATVS
jgi:hypothetical protein